MPVSKCKLVIVVASAVAGSSARRTQSAVGHPSAAGGDIGPQADHRRFGAHQE